MSDDKQEKNQEKKKMDGVPLTLVGLVTDNLVETFGNRVVPVEVTNKILGHLQEIVNDFIGLPMYVAPARQLKGTLPQNVPEPTMPTLDVPKEEKS